MKFARLFTLFLCLPIMGWGYFDCSLSLTQFASKRWDIHNGLDDSWVRGICEIEDRPGIWMATGKGITYFNGVAFRTFDDTSSNLLSGGANCLESAGPGKMYVGTERNGVVIFEDGKITPLGNFQLYDSMVVDLKLDSRGYLWIGTTKGLFVKKGETIVPFPLENPITAKIQEIEEDSDGFIWVGSRDSLKIIDPIGNRIVKEFQELSFTNCILHENESTTWIGTSDGFFVIRNDVVEKVSLDSLNLIKDRIISMEMDGNGCIFVGTLDGVVRFKDGQLVDSKAASPYNINSYQCLHLDKEGTLWMGTRYSGVWQLWSDEFTVYSHEEGLNDPVINVVYEDPEGLVWIGTDEGLHTLQKNEIEPVYNELFSNTRIRDLLKDSQNNLWVATYSGAFKINSSGVEVFTKQNGFPSDFVRQIIEDQQGRIWIGTRAGLVLIDGDQRVVWGQDDLNSVFILSIHEDASGNIWIGTDGAGFAKYLENGTFQWFDSDNGLVDGFVFKIHSDPQGRLWLSTANGISMYDGEQFHHFSRPDGLPFETIFQIMETNDGMFWLVSREGPIKMAKEDLLKYWAGELDEVPSKIYNHADGLRSSKMTSVGESCILSDGAITFCSRDGVAMFYDREGMQNGLLDEGAHIDAIQVNDEQTIDIAYTKDTYIELEPGLKSLDIQFVTNSLIAGNDAVYRVRLDGFDDTFRETSETNISYTNLDPGHYSFRVFSDNFGNGWNEKPATLSFYIKPHFNQTLWFKLLLGVLLIFLIWTIVHLRSLQMRIQRDKLEATVEMRTREVVDQKEIIEAKVLQNEKTLRQLELSNSELKRVNEEKSKLLGIAAHDIKNPISVIQFISNEIVEGGNSHRECVEYAGMISRSSTELFDLVNRLTESLSLEGSSLRIKKEAEDLVVIMQSVFRMNQKPSENKHITLTSNSPEKIEANVDGLRIQMAMDNYVSNAIKFSPKGGEVHISMSTYTEDTRAFARFEVTDSGPGLSDKDFDLCFKRFSLLSAKPTGEETSSGLGLSIVKQVVELHGGTVSVENASEGGAKFAFDLPLA